MAETMADKAKKQRASKVKGLHEGVGKFKGKKSLNLRDKQLGKKGRAAAKKRTVSISKTEHMKEGPNKGKVVGPAGKPLTGKVDMGGGNMAVYRNGKRVTAKPATEKNGKGGSGGGANTTSSRSTNPSKNTSPPKKVTPPKKTTTTKKTTATKATANKATASQRATINATRGKGSTSVSMTANKPPKPTLTTAQKLAARAKAKSNQTKKDTNQTKTFRTGEPGKRTHIDTLKETAAKKRKDNVRNSGARNQSAAQINSRKTKLVGYGEKKVNKKFDAQKAKTAKEAKTAATVAALEKKIKDLSKYQKGM